MGQTLSDLIKEQREITAALRVTANVSKHIAKSYRVDLNKDMIRSTVLLRITEFLISAHMAAKIDGDGTTLDYIEDALRHVGERLAREHGDDRNFKRKRVEPV